jgi:hypothetical protein
MNQFCEAVMYVHGKNRMDFAYDERHGCLVCKRDNREYSIRPNPLGGIWIAELSTNILGDPVWVPSEIKPIKIVFSDGAEYIFPVEEA